MFDIGEAVRVTEQAIDKDYVGLEGNVTGIQIGSMSRPNDIGVSVKVYDTTMSGCPSRYFVGQSITFWQKVYPLELVNPTNPVCEDWS